MDTPVFPEKHSEMIKATLFIGADIKILSRTAIDLCKDPVGKKDSRIKLAKLISREAPPERSCSFIHFLRLLQNYRKL